MDFDYLDEIKIEKKPRLPAVQGTKSLQKQQKKEDLINQLRSKNALEEHDAELTNTDIELYKQAIAREKTIEAAKAKKEIPAKTQTVSAPKTVKNETSADSDTKKDKDGLGNHIIVKYLCKELLLYFVVWFGLFFVVFFVNNILLLAETILRQHVKVSSVMKLILYCLPGIVAQSAPFATLVGFLMCLGRMVTDNEIMILRATGHRYRVILLPVVFTGLVISIFSFVMNDYFLPLGILKFNRLRRQIVQSDPAVEIEPNTVKRMNGTTLIIGDVGSDSVISDMVFFDTDSEGNDRIIITENDSVEKSQDDNILMKFKMGKTSVFSINSSDRNKYDVLESQNATFNVFDTIITDSVTRIAPREMTSLDLWKQIKQMSTDESVTKKRMNQYKLEFNKKFSMPFGSIFFALLAFPLSLIFGKKDGLTLGLIFGIIISVLYWAASILGQLFGVKSGWNGFLMMWIPNFAIGIGGILLYLRLRRK